MLMRILVIALLACASIYSQTITGSIAGSVVDPSGLAVVGAEVTLTQPATGFSRQMSSDERGYFVFASLAPGTYTLEVVMDGFKRFEQTRINLTASELLSVGELTLEVGSLTESVTVTAEGAQVQTASAERAGVITNSQVENLLIRGRNVMSLLSLLPGVVDIDNPESISRNWNLYVNGNRRNTNGVSLDGMTLNAIGNNYNMLVGVSQDAVAEVKVLLSNYQAEYGRMSGANIQLVTKSGTKDFHGLVSYFKRHEQFNANNFFNNRLGTAKPRYRFNTWNYNVGGPVYIPGKFNTSKEKLFFFFSQEYWPLTVPRPIAQLTVPTGLERQGDFSQSLDLNNKLIVVRDPRNSRNPFPGNLVPAGQINPSGQALLNVFPSPNFLDRSVSAGRYNYVFQEENSTPQRTETLKLDYNVNSSNLVAFNYTQYSDVQEGAIGIASSGGTNWPQMRKKFDNQGKAFIGRYQRIISPTLVNELNIGFVHRPADDVVFPDELKKNQRENVGYTLSQFNPAANPLNVIPNATYGGVTQPANLIIEGRFPLVTTHDNISITNNVTKSMGAHTVKGGFYFDRFWRNASNAVNFNGNFNFGTNVNNPLDTNYAYANGLLGVFNSYTEASDRPFAHFRLSNIEWFVQDNWRLTRRFTLDVGMRFYMVRPLYEDNNLVSGFVPSRFDPAAQPQLIMPFVSGGKRVGRHPVTGEIFPISSIGAIAPGTGDPTNGMVHTGADPSVPRSLIEDRGVHYSPRIGFAWDVFGTGKTAVRGGFGMFYNRQNLDAVLNPFTTQAPLVSNPVVNFGTMAELLNSTGVVFPQNVVGIDQQGYVPSVYNFSMSVQQNIGFGTVVDMGYVGSLGRHLMWQRDINPIPLGANFNPANVDPANPKVPLSAAFLRPRIGYNNINFREWASSSNYHSLQVSANRRFAQGVQFGASWTWSKSMDFNSNDTEAITPLVDVRVWNYGLSTFDRTHVAKINWLWDVPKTSATNPFLRAVVNNWQVSGIASFISGQPLGVGYSTTVSTDITGSASQGARVVVLDNPVLPKSERTFSRFFRTDVFAMPAKGTIGNSAKSVLRGPGVNNWDVALFKTFPIRERVGIQFRWELYNAFNHTQFSAVDTAARFDPQGNQVNSRFGEMTAARNPRQMQFALRLHF